MRMAYWMRITLGVVLGLAALVALWLLVGVTWLTAAAAALLAPIGFLGSYFIWSADRPEEGYEQVLFDRPNTIVSAVMLVLFAGAGVASGFVSLGGASAPTPADELAALHAEYMATSDAFATGSLGVEAATEALNALRERLDVSYAALEALPAGAQKESLLEAADFLAQAIVELKTCAAGESEKCVDARLSSADVQAALERAAA